MTALLHDTIEDTKGTYSEIAEEFGTDVAELVDGVTKLTNLQLSAAARPSRPRTSASCSWRCPRICA
jgi:(p)ppGpp synthase/HD superfamily hydrolase